MSGVELLRQAEAAPVAWPVVQLPTAALLAGVDPGTVWRRIEAYVSHRWSPREIAWVVDGAGEWTPPLGPVQVLAAERWTGAAWESCNLFAGPLGYELQGATYRVTATVGAGPVPEDVAEAFRRLAEYFAATSAQRLVDDPEHRVTDPGALHPGASRLEMSEGEQSLTIERNPAHLARAIQNSGAADLLRPYRRAP